MNFRLLNFSIGFVLLSLTAFQKKMFIESNMVLSYFLASTVSIFLLFSSFAGKRIFSFVGLMAITLLECIFWFIPFMAVKLNKYHFPTKTFYTDFLLYSHRNFIQYHRDLGQYDSELFYRLSPDTNGQFSNFEFSTAFHTNSIGTRDDEQSIDNHQLLLLGDSYTMGWGVDEDETVDHQLEQLTKLKVLNLGICSYGTFREYQKSLRVQSESLKAVILQYHETDLTENIEKLKLESESKNLNSNLELADYEIQCRFNDITRTYFPLKGLHCLFGHLLHYLKSQLPIKAAMAMETRPDEIAEHYNHFILVARKIKNLKKVPLIVYYVGNYPQIENDFEEKLRSEEDIHFVRVNSLLEPQDKFVFDEHTNSNGQKKTAELLFEKIKSLGLIEI